MFQIGDIVVDRHFFVCKIESQGKTPFEPFGQDYFTLRPVYPHKNDTTVFVPTCATDGIRPIVTKEEGEKLLRAFPRMKASVFTAKKQPMLIAHYQALLSQGTEQTLLLLKEIALKEKNNPKKVSENDAKYKAKAMTLLSEELAQALQKTPSEIQTEIEIALYK